MCIQKCQRSVWTYLETVLLLFKKKIKNLIPLEMLQSFQPHLVTTIAAPKEQTVSTARSEMLVSLKAVWPLHCLSTRVRWQVFNSWMLHFFNCKKQQWNLGDPYPRCWCVCVKWILINLSSFCNLPLYSPYQPKNYSIALYIRAYNDEEHAMWLKALEHFQSFCEPGWYGIFDICFWKKYQLIHQIFMDI